MISHIDQFARLFNLEKTGLLHDMQGYAVDMFFVLSGFLITYLLFLEKEKTKTISLKKFYLRRIFRIWPIYYLSVLISVILVVLNVVPPPNNISLSLGLYTFLAANVAFVLNATISTITPLWSVGVEEQFYLGWPHIIKRSSNYLLAFGVFYLLFEVLKLLVYFLFSPESVLYYFISITSINIMCMGAMGAYLVSKKHYLLKIIYRREVQIISWGVLLFSCIYKPIHVFTFIDQEVNSFFYLIIIINISSNPHSIINLENAWLNFLGRISYGIYVYHMIAIYAAAYGLQVLGVHTNVFLMYLSASIVTILCSAISYYYFEMLFLNRKKKFSIVSSTNKIEK